MRRLIVLAVALAALAAATPAQANYLETNPRYTYEGRTCQLRVGSSLFDDSTYFLGLDIIADYQGGCGGIAGDGFNFPYVGKYGGGQACHWSTDRSNPAPAVTVWRYMFTVCQGAPAWYVSIHRHDISLHGSGRWVLPPGTHYPGANRTVTVSADRQYMTIQHNNAEYIQ